MAKISISEAARLAGISRSHLYTAFIKTGKISIETIDDATAKQVKQIDTAELIRVFGNLKARTEDNDRTGQARTTKDTLEDNQNTTQDSTSIAVLVERVHGLEALLEAKHEALERSQAENARLIGIVENQTRLLEYKPIQQKGRTWMLLLVVALSVTMTAAAIWFWPASTSRPSVPSAPHSLPPIAPATPPDQREPWKPDDNGG